MDEQTTATTEAVPMEEQTLLDVAADLADKAEELGACGASVTFDFPMDHNMVGAKVTLTVELPGFEDCSLEEELYGVEDDEEEAEGDDPAAEASEPKA